MQAVNVAFAFLAVSHDARATHIGVKSPVLTASEEEC